MFKSILKSAPAIIGLAMVLFTGTFQTAHAMSVNPVVIDLEAVGSKSRGQINVINTLTYDLPVEITISKVSLSETGEVTTTPVSDENFLIFPPQALIEPGATQVFRVQWIGEPDLAESETYAFSVAQLPVELSEGTSGIQLLYNFQVITSVAPARAEPELELLGTDITVGEDNQPRPVLSVRNNGTAHGYFSGTRLRLEMSDESGKRIWSETYEPTELAQTIGLGLIEPGKQRQLILPINLPEEKGTLRASFRYVGRR